MYKMYKKIKSFIKKSWDSYCEVYALYYWDYPYEVFVTHKEEKKNEKGDK